MYIWPDLTFYFDCRKVDIKMAAIVGCNCQTLVAGYLIIVITIIIIIVIIIVTIIATTIIVNIIVTIIIIILLSKRGDKFILDKKIFFV